MLEKVERSVKVKRYSEALDDLNAAIEADPTLSEAYFRRASILRQLCRLVGIAYFLFQKFKLLLIVVLIEKDTIFMPLPCKMPNCLQLFILALNSYESNNHLR